MTCILNRSPYEAASRNTEHPCFPWQCPRCGWNAEERERRINGGLVTGSDGLKHFTKSKAVIHSDDRGN